MMSNRPGLVKSGARPVSFDSRFCQIDQFPPDRIMVTVPAMAAASSTCHRRQDIVASRQQVVERAEACFRADLGTPVPVSTLCRLVGLSERGLRNAFYGVHGVGPKQWMLALRLRAVRRALTDPDHHATTVTDIAISYGFDELGRFAANYKRAFGETPSATLRGSGRQAASATTST